MTLDDTTHLRIIKESQGYPKDATPGFLATFGIAAGLGAVVASSCCVVPLVLGAFGAGAVVFSGMEAIAPWRVPLLEISGLTLVGAWASWWRKRQVICTSKSACATKRGPRLTLALLSLSSLVVITALSWNYLEPVLLKIMRH